MTLTPGGPRVTPRGRSDTHVHLRVARGFIDSLSLYCALTGEKRSDWIRRTLMDGLERGLAAFPVRFCWLRPGAVVYSLTRGVYAPVATAAGGERAWPIEVVSMPSALSTLKMGWRIDVTSSTGGYEGRDVYVTLEAVVGQKPPVIHTD